jgi:hypothetical protein
MRSFARARAISAAGNELSPDSDLGGGGDHGVGR